MWLVRIVKQKRKTMKKTTKQQQRKQKEQTTKETKRRQKKNNEKQKQRCNESKQNQIITAKLNKNKDYKPFVLLKL